MIVKTFVIPVHTSALVDCQPKTNPVEKIIESTIEKYCSEKLESEYTRLLEVERTVSSAVSDNGDFNLILFVTSKFEIC